MIVSDKKDSYMRLTQKVNIYGIVLELILLGSASVAQTPQKSPSNQFIMHAEKVVEQLSQQKFSEAVKSFDLVLTGSLPVEKLQEVWRNLTAQLGNFEKMLLSRTEKRQGYVIVFVTCEFTRTIIDIKIVFNAQQQVTGLWFVPSPTLDFTPSPTPDYVDVNSFTEKQVQIGAEPWLLPGMLTIPKGPGPFPAVVLVHSSGPLDRDETIGANKPFRDLAWGLAGKGIAVLRYDKRSKVYPEEVTAIMNRLTVQEETIDDALAAVKLLCNNQKIDAGKIYILGYSLGGMLAPRIVQEDPNLVGMIILAGNTRRLEDIYSAQINYLLSLDGEISSDDNERLKKVKQQIGRVKNPDLLAKYSSNQLPLALPASYWLDLDKYNPAQVAKRLDKPMLILQGGRDYQVTLDDFRGWKKELESLDKVEFKLYLKLNHLFMLGKGTGKSTPDEYKIAGHVDKNVVEDIAAWIKKQ